MRRKPLHQDVKINHGPYPICTKNTTNKCEHESEQKFEHKFVPNVEPRQMY